MISGGLDIVKRKELISYLTVSEVWKCRSRREPLSKYCKVKTSWNFVCSFSQHTAPLAAVLPAGDLHQWIMMTSCCVKSYFTYNTRIQHSQLAIIFIAQMFLVIKVFSEQISRLHLSVSTEQGAGCLLHVSTHHHIVIIKWFKQGIFRRIITTSSLLQLSLTILNTRLRSRYSSISA